jgi:hypothetical protein
MMRSLTVAVEFETPHARLIPRPGQRKTLKVTTPTRSMVTRCFVFTPFMGIGSEVCAAVVSGRRGVGVELKESYYRQAVRNVAAAAHATPTEQGTLIHV